MNNYIISDINSTQKKKWKQLWQLGNKHLVIIDESIIQKLGITENSTIFLEQEIDHDNTIRMRIKKF
jgi:hypothetical protein